jgi:fibro-slime domain-containing protein
LVACGGGNTPQQNVVTTAGAGGGGAGDNSGGAAGDEEPGGIAGTQGLIPDEGGSGGFCSDSSCGGSSGDTGGSGGGGTLCGNGQLDPGEQCDDGNASPGDGCTGACNLEPNYACNTVGQACTSTIACGDGTVAGTEACDDGNHDDNDGCAADCTVEDNFGCTTDADGSSSCIPIQNGACGDSTVNSGEQCDDGNSDPNDGCSDTCKVEAGYVCSTVGQPCDHVEYCGDGFLKGDGSEQCDDGNRSPVDGCDGSCVILPNFVCPDPGQPCQSTIVCGDGQITGNEKCDDGDTDSGDGCSSSCNAEPGYTCTGGGNTPVAGPCQPVAVERCGDNALAATEFCDDGANADGDGCSATCTIEPGWDCPGGKNCVRVGSCGDGLVNVVGEECDDGVDGVTHQPKSGDGCTATCKREALFSCPPAGGACTSTVVCGDGVVNGAETCDDGNTLGGDGCNASCKIESGWVCPVGGVCRTVCGDGIRIGEDADGIVHEQCDDKNLTAGDGCGADCRLEDGFKCDDPVSPANAKDVCTHTVCGDGAPEGTEQCDDGNLAPYDGCDRFCHKEPKCSGSPYECGAVCGDGMKFPEEECDDGNTSDGDGCSFDCKLEDGFDCTNDAADLGSSIQLPIIFRDFNSSHPQFEVNPGSGGVTSGMVLVNLGSNGKPQYNVNFSANSRADFSMDGAKPNATGTRTLSDAEITTNFNQWYVTDGTNNKQVLSTLTLTESPAGSGSYQFAASLSSTPPAQFFPLDGKGFNEQTSTASNGTHNFHFTSEARQWFLYQSSATHPLLTFSGDDDVWVFVNGTLAVDLGGIHGEKTGSIELIGTTGQSSCTRIPAVTGTCSNPGIILDPNGVNEIAVFQAERHVTQSNYTLTMKGFNAPITSCNSNCGDGVITADEACDIKNGNTGAYGTCNADCTLPARCGDGITNGPEQCDNGINTSTREVVAPTNGSVGNPGTGDCAPGCVRAPRCGDGQLQGQFEQCDLGSASNTGAYGTCNSNCTLPARCGDGVKNGPEQCDTGANNGSGGSPCLANCTLRCGNGQIDQGEQCDDGLANNTGGYGKCEANCTLGPRCGDAVPDSGEACDDGLNDGSYGHCGVGCQPGPFCGDGTLQSQFGETCDNGGANVASGYGSGLCTTQCKPAPFCGNHAVDVTAGEVCDDGVNDGQPGSCAPDCKSAIPLTSCGNGQVQAGEQCDNGNNNGKPGNACDVRCELACGNGYVDATEQCDDGVNNGSYGTCNSNCTFAAFCGDGIKQGPEDCDDGPGNIAPANAYGSGVCTTSCTRAPFCGDHRVDNAFGEMCDGGAACTSACSILR